MGFTVYDTKKNKYYDIHPSMAKDKRWLQSRGLILQEEPKKMEVTNMDKPVVVTEPPAEPVKITAPKAKTPTQKQA